jgi:hypothetical protein
MIRPDDPVRPEVEGLPVMIFEELHKNGTVKPVDLERKSDDSTHVWILREMIECYRLSAKLRFCLASILK